MTVRLTEMFIPCSFGLLFADLVCASLASLRYRIARTYQELAIHGQKPSLGTLTPLEDVDGSSEFLGGEERLGGEEPRILGVTHR